MDKINVTCGSCGVPFMTKVRGRGASCPSCHKQTYVRQDGTTKIDAGKSVNPAAPKTAPPKGVVKVGYAKPKPQPKEKDPTTVDPNSEPPGVQQPSNPGGNPPPTRQRAAKAAVPGGTPNPAPRVKRSADNGTGRQRRVQLGTGHPYGDLFNW